MKKLLYTSLSVFLFGSFCLAMEKPLTDRDIVLTIVDGSPEDLRKIAPLIDKSRGLQYLMAALSPFSPWNENRIRNLEFLLNEKMGFYQKDWAKEALAALNRAKSRVTEILGHLAQTAGPMPPEHQFISSYSAREESAKKAHDREVNFQRNQLRLINEAIKLVETA